MLRNLVQEMFISCNEVKMNVLDAFKLILISLKNKTDSFTKHVLSIITRIIRYSNSLSYDQIALSVLSREKSHVKNCNVMISKYFEFSDGTSPLANYGRLWFTTVDHSLLWLTLRRFIVKE